MNSYDFDLYPSCSLVNDKAVSVLSKFINQNQTFVNNKIIQEGKIANSF